MQKCFSNDYRYGEERSLYPSGAGNAALMVSYLVIGEGNVYLRNKKRFGKNRREAADMFGRKKQEKRSYDPQQEKPVIRKSICTGDMTAGFKDLHSGTYHDVMLIRGEADLQKFMEMYDIASRPETEY